MSIPEIGPIIGTNFCYMFALDTKNNPYSGILVFTEGQPLPNFIFDPRTPYGDIINFSNFNSYSTMTVRRATDGIVYSIGYADPYLDVTASPSNIVPITVEANDDYWPSDNVTALAGVGYDIFYDGDVRPFRAYIPDGSGNIKKNNEGIPLIQSLYGKFYFFTLTWYPISDCSVTLSDQNTIHKIVTSWLTNNTMPSTQYFTETSDCKIAFPYKYCQFRQACTGECNGPCSDPNLVCTLDNNNKQYYCSGKTSESTDLTPYYIVIVLLAIVSIAFLVLIILK